MLSPFSLSPVFCFSVAACDVDALYVAASDPPHAVPPNTIAVVIANAKILFLIVFSFFLLFIETVLTVQLHWKLSDILF